jgi:hypothetical protein
MAIDSGRDDNGNVPFEFGSTSCKQRNSKSPPISCCIRLQWFAPVFTDCDGSNPWFRSAADSSRAKENAAELVQRARSEEVPQ